MTTNIEVLDAIKINEFCDGIYKKDFALILVTYLGGLLYDCKIYDMRNYNNFPNISYSFTNRTYHEITSFIRETVYTINN